MPEPHIIRTALTGDQVISPMAAIAEYEKSHSIPPGYINTAISAGAPNGAWQRLERGEMISDKTFFTAFKSDLCNPSTWKKYNEQYFKRQGHSDRPIPSVPDIDAEGLYWNMMGNSRAPDPHIYPALQRLRQIADKSGKFIVAACSNTSLFPEGHPFNDPSTPEGRFMAELRSNFHLYVSSAHVGHRKPEPAIYALTLKECERVAKERGVLKADEKLDPGEVVFLDDIGSNLRGAKQQGIKGIKVVLGKTDQAVAELERATGLELAVRSSAKL